MQVGADNGGDNYGSFCKLSEENREKIGSSETWNTWVLHVPAEQLYFDLVFSSWSDGGDGVLAYTRTAVKTNSTAANGPCFRLPCTAGDRNHYMY